MTQSNNDSFDFSEIKESDLEKQQKLIDKKKQQSKDLENLHKDVSDTINEKIGDS